MTKIAVCISGQARSWAKGYEYLAKNLLSQPGIDADIFIHTWDTTESVAILSIYNPRASIIAPQKQFDVLRYTNVPPPTPGWSVKNPAFGTVSQLYSINRANYLKEIYGSETYIKYDWVVRTRFDFALNAVIPFNNLDPEKLYVPNCRMTPERDFCNDQFAFGGPKVMSLYSQTYASLDYFYDRGVMMIGEEMLSANLKRQCLIGDKLVYVDMHHPFPPGAHNGTWHSLIRDDVHNWSR